jgi:hypothetical protein
MTNENGAAGMRAPDGATTYTFTVSDDTSPRYPRGGDPRLRMHWHHIFRRRRRWSRELDRLCAVREAA